MAKRVIVTADDLGIADEINRGIIDAHTRGVVTAASLLMNAPATAAAIELARAHPSLEVGLHLSLVEGLSLRGKASTVTDKLRYFGDGLCLHRHWRQFIPRYSLGLIDIGELEAELRLQIEAFLRYFPGIPFANGTQHLHLLPKVQDVLLRLAGEYGIAALRAPGPRDPGGRLPFGPVLRALGMRLRKRQQHGRPAMTDAFAGFAVSGALDEAALLAIIAALPEGTTEIMAHPGYDCPALRQGLPWGYATFRWQDELAAVQSPRVKAALAAQGVELIRFGDLADAA